VYNFCLSFTSFICIKSRRDPEETALEGPLILKRMFVKRNVNEEFCKCISVHPMERFLRRGRDRSLVSSFPMFLKTGLEVGGICCTVNP
jgi:hypothetical protein